MKFSMIVGGYLLQFGGTHQTKWIKIFDELGSFKINIINDNCLDCIKAISFIVSLPSVAESLRW